MAIRPISLIWKAKTAHTEDSVYPPSCTLKFMIRIVGWWFHGTQDSRNTIPHSKRSICWTIVIGVEYTWNCTCAPFLYTKKLVSMHWVSQGCYMHIVTHHHQLLYRLCKSPGPVTASVSSFQGISYSPMKAHQYPNW